MINQVVPPLQRLLNNSTLKVLYLLDCAEKGSWLIIHAVLSLVIHVMEAKSLDPRLARQLKDALSNQNDITYHGLTNGRYASLPLGVWGGRIGILFRDDIHDLFERFQVAVAEHNQIAERTDLELESAFDEMDQEMGQYRAFMNLHYVWSQKVERPLVTP